MLTNIGIRIEGNEPSNIGLTLQRKIASHTNLEGIVHLSDNTFGFSGIYERYHNITSNYTLDFYYGGGVTVFFIVISMQVFLALLHCVINLRIYLLIFLSTGNQLFILLMLLFLGLIK
jgi:hypothetical protein